MPIVTSQQISKYYETFKTIDVVFTKEVVKATALQPRQVWLKCLGEQWPCVLYSTSLSGARILASRKGALGSRLKRANGLVNLRFSFRVSEKADPRAFFVSGRVAGFAPYPQTESDLQFINIQYTQQPPDDLIEILGRLLEANVNSARRRDERVLLTPDAIRRLNLSSKDTQVFIQGVPRKCILRDLSFGGVKAILVGIAKFLTGKECLVRMDFEDPREVMDIPGTIVRCEEVEGRRDLAAIAVQFDEQRIPINYKLHVNDYVGMFRSARVEGGRAESAPLEVGGRDGNV
ncbi:MAG TPA: PilZ domain-containing protein [Magnetospirillaceae bacterium]|nr:PilZ domain-containing protein [Magnetospirillaceae bacterium]